MSDGNGEMGAKTGSAQQIERTRWSRKVNQYMGQLALAEGVVTRDPELTARRIARLDEQIAAAQQEGKWHMVARYTQRRIDIEEEGWTSDVGGKSASDQVPSRIEDDGPGHQPGGEIEVHRSHIRPCAIHAIDDH